MKRALCLMLLLASCGYGDWDPTKPADDRAYNLRDDDIRANWEALDTILGISSSATEPNLVPCFNVVAFGAATDGTTEAATEIQAAIDAAEAAGGGEVFFPEGHYKVSTTLVVDADSVWLVGEGRAASEIRYYGTGAAITIGTSGGTARNYCGIEKLYVVYYGDTAYASGTIGAAQYSGHNLTIQDSWINRFETQILLDGDGDGGDMGYIVGPFLNNVRLSGKIGLDMQTPVTALSARGLIIVGPGKTETGSYGIKQDNVGAGNWFHGTSIETHNTAVELGTYLQYFGGLRVEHCTNVISVASGSVDQCTILGGEYVSCTTVLSSIPSGAQNNRFELNGSMCFVTDGTNKNVFEGWFAGDTQELQTYYDPGTGLRYRYAGNYDLFHINLDGTVVADYVLQAGPQASHAGKLRLYEDSDDGDNYVEFHAQPTDSNQTMYPIYTAVVDCNAAEVNALAATQIELVAAQGAGTLIEFVGATLILDVTAQYDDAAGDGDLQICYTDGDGTAVSAAIEADAFIDAAADAVTFAIPVADPITAASACVNKALVLDNDGDEFTGGTGELRVIITYRVHTSLGL